MTVSKVNERQVICEGCGGSGRRPLRPTESATLRAVTAAWRSTDEIHASLHRVSPTALVNRLNHLYNLGLISKRSSPKFYRAAEWRLS